MLIFPIDLITSAILQTVGCFVPAVYQLYGWICFCQAKIPGQGQIVFALSGYDDGTISCYDYSKFSADEKLWPCQYPLVPYDTTYGFRVWHFFIETVFYDSST